MKYLVSYCLQEIKAFAFKIFLFLAFLKYYSNQNQKNPNQIT